MESTTTTNQPHPATNQPRRWNPRRPRTTHGHTVTTPPRRPLTGREQRRPHHSRTQRRQSHIERAAAPMESTTTTNQPHPATNQPSRWNPRRPRTTHGHTVTTSPRPPHHSRTRTDTQRPHHHEPATATPSPHHHGQRWQVESSGHHVTTAATSQPDTAATTSPRTSGDNPTSRESSRADGIHTQPRATLAGIRAAATTSQPPPRRPIHTDNRAAATVNRPAATTSPPRTSGHRAAATAKNRADDSGHNPTSREQLRPVGTFLAKIFMLFCGCFAAVLRND